MICLFCQREWDCERLGLICPYCKQRNVIPAEERPALCVRAAAAERTKKNDEALHLYTLLAESHDPEGGEGFGRCLENGLGTPIDVNRAAIAYFLAAEDGSDHAAFRLGKLLAAHPNLQTGNGTPLFWGRVAATFCVDEAAFWLYESGRRLGVPEEERFYWLCEAALAGNPSALLQLAQIYKTGRGAEKNAAKALYCMEHASHTPWLFRALHRNIVPQKPTLPVFEHYAAFLFALGEEAVEINASSVALRIFLLASEEGSGEAAFRAGVCYRDGGGGIRDTDEALRLFALASSRGVAEADLMQAQIYEKTDGKLGEAEAHYRAAAETGNAEYALAFANFYLTNDREAGIRHAVPWLRRAADGGLADARRRLTEIESSLSDMYNRALEAQEAGDMKNAFELYKNAAALGHAGSLCNLGTCLRRGLGCRVDLRAAAEAYRGAVEAGSIPARLNLAVCCRNGEGVRRSFREARKLLAGMPAAFAAQAKQILDEMDQKRAEKKAGRLYSAAAAAFHRGDVNASLALRLEAAKGGNARAAYMIGCHFEFGDGVEMNRERAQAFYEGAATAGYNGSHARLKSGYLRERRRFDQ